MVVSLGVIVFPEAGLTPCEIEEHAHVLANNEILSEDIFRWFRVRQTNMLCKQCGGSFEQL